MNYYELTPENNTFNNIVIDLTHRCNMECNNCYIPNRTIPDIDTSKLYDFLSKLPDRVYIRLIGAEPTMRNDIFEIIETVIKLGHRPSITTNGLKLGNMEYLQRLKDAGLRLFLLSMNGADDDEIYQLLDAGKWATIKTRALSNIFKLRLPINTGTIIAKGINEKTILQQVKTFARIAIENDVNFDTTNPYRRITPVLRMKSVGLIGRNMGATASYTSKDLAKLASEQLKIPLDTILNSAVVAGSVVTTAVGESKTSLAFDCQTDAGKVIIRLINWDIDDEGVIDHDNTNRGRLTENWTIAPFFEHVKKNEYGY